MAKKKPHSMETALIILELLRRIPSRRKISARQLQEQLNHAGFERDIRSIQRLLEEITLHFDIERDDEHKPYGYRWGERRGGFSVPQLSEHESVLLTLAEQHLRSLLPPALVKSMAMFFDQARTNLTTAADNSLEKEWLAKVRVVSTTQPLLPPKIEPKIFETVSAALYSNLWLEVDYKNAEGKRIKDDVMPLGLAQQGTRLYLVCRFDGYDNERSLALNRIIEARVTTLPFTRPKSFNLQKYDEEGRFGFSEGKRIRLRFEISKSAGLHLLESPLSKDQQVKEKGNYYQITATLMDTEQLTWWLKSFGNEVRKIHKQQIRSK